LKRPKYIHKNLHAVLSNTVPAVRIGENVLGKTSSEMRPNLVLILPENHTNSLRLGHFETNQKVGYRRAGTGKVHRPIEELARTENFRHSRLSNWTA